MKRPRIALESEQQITELYDYYRQYEPPRAVSQLAWRAFNGVYRPDVFFMNRAETELHDLREQGVPQIYAFNHLTNIHDQFVTGAVLQQIAPEYAGRTRILTKDPVMRLMGRFGDALGGIPAFRIKDNSERADLLDVTNEALFNTIAHTLTNQQNLAVYPEGTHNRHDPRTLGKVRRGIGEIATRVLTFDSPLAIIPIGMSYRGSGMLANPHRATVVVGNTYHVAPNDTVDSVTESTRNRLQRVVTVVHNLFPQP